MFLKRLETVGFKSFADRTTIQFVPGITAVVGPNGSGKSNVIDAVRWVLGEQSAKSLRGARMEDIIFQGSDSRKALNFAEVTIVLNNEKSELPIDYQEVSITRRVYRSGESEFYMNKQPCRLKDIVDLFMDTGLGRESFSIIGQGKIDEILSSKAEERRAIFEEAAGVLKYKQRKQRAEVKLEDTSDNLDRVKDIIHEIEKQIDPLKIQAEKAITFKEKKESLQKVEVSLLVTEIEQLHEEWQALLGHIEQKRLEEIEKQTIIQRRTATMTETRENVQQLDDDMQSLQADLVRLTEQIEQLDGKKSVLEERAKHATESKARLLEEQELQKGNINSTTEKIIKEQEQIAHVISSLQEVSQKISALKKSKTNTVESHATKIDSLKSDYIESLNEQAALRNEEKTIQTQLEQIQDRNNEQYTTAENHLIQREKNEKEVHRIKTSLQKKRHRIEELKTSIENVEEQHTTLERTYASMQRKLYEGNERIATLSSRKEMLEDMKDNFQGFFYGVKAILQAHKKGKIDQIDGVVLDLMDVPKEYITAIDTILGAQAQHIVVQDDRIARNIIQWLKREKKGRATFLPIASISKRTIPAHMLHKIEQEDGFIGIAANLVHIDNKYRIVIDHLMGNAIVTDSLKTATKIASMTNRGFRIVTLEGDIVYPGGSMSGGAKKQNNTSLFTREKELKTITATLKTFQQRKDEFLGKMDETRAKQTELADDLVEKQTLLEKYDIQYDELQSEWNALQVTIAKTEDQLTSYELFKAQFSEEKSQLMQKQKATENQLEIVGNKIKETESAIEQLTDDLKELEADEKTTEKALHELEKQSIELNERKNYFEQRTQDLREEMEQFQCSLTDIENELEEMRQLEQLAEKTHMMEKDVNELKVNRDTILAQLENDRENRSKQLQWVQDEERELHGLQRVYEQFVKEVQELEVKANRLDVALENRLNTLQSEYVMTYEYAKKQYGITSDIDWATTQVKQIKTEIDRLGTVNLGAIEEYDRLKDRYEFLTEQRDDLTDAKETLYTVIREMDKEMTERFKEVFTIIQQAFSTVFKKLFGGGQASLTLTEPDDLLTTGIDIVAQPPGKKLQSLALLSGGERALTAIALLFAILRTRAVPFVILDEVDAALDEANVIRFSKYLKSYREETQFIVITHRNGTMEEADVLYGVTMQESGVSKLVSVKLEESKEIVNQE